jgi:pimeloyl-ACP methyl ester carboxylesterase
MAIGTYVLVHGAWHGGWCWAKVARLLRDAGHEVFTPTLTGLGERAHLARPEIDLETHIQDVVAVLETEELRGVTLVGHSYGGMVITGAAARATAGRLAQLVYLDAFVPEAGKALLDYVGPRAEAMREAARTQGEGWKIPSFPPERFGVTSQRDTEWLTRRLVPQPLRTFEQPLPAAGGERLKRTYIYCSKPAMGAFDQFAPRLRDDRKWVFHDVKTGHDAMVTAPGEIAKILMGK